MLEKFSNYNLFWTIADLEQFVKVDRQLLVLSEQRLKFEYDFDLKFEADYPGVFLLSGGRQLGKSTSIKKLILKLLKTGTQPNQIFYLPCELLQDRLELLHCCNEFLNSFGQARNYLFIDEITYLENWELSIKALYDAGSLARTTCLVSGSDKILIENAITRLAGRRGEASKVDWQISSLTFKQFVSLFENSRPEDLKLEIYFEKYIRTGGYLKAINDLDKSGKIQDSTIKTYQDWVVGDMLRLGKRKEYLMQVLFAILKSYGSQVSNHSLAEHTEGMTQETLADYCHLLERLDVFSFQRAFDQNSLRAAPKKNKKAHFLDPFILYALTNLIDLEYNKINLPDVSHIVESIAFAHLRKLYPTYYIKADGEVDLVWVENDIFHPAEIKWRNQVRGSDLKQLSKYGNAIVLTKEKEAKRLGEIPCRWLVDFIFSL